ncbi:hypothetical protein [Anaerotignum sp.]
MAKNYKPSVPFNVAMKLLVPVTTKEYGVVKKSFSTPEESDLFYGSFRTFGGTERMNNDVYTIINTAVIDTWYRPDIKADCQIYICETEQTYNIVSDPEDIDFRHQYLQFKVQKVGGKP